MVISPGVESLREELLNIVKKELNPLSEQLKYSQSPLDDTIKWRPIVLILGNYSSGKSTLINELLGVDLQKTGQAPTDDSFTVITYDNHGEIPLNEDSRTWDGKTILNDSQYPFEHLKKHGQRFASHFLLKKIRQDFVHDIAIVDTPGMVDSVAERDRGYNYQQVIGDFAKIADLILILFDPHKAGTIKEAYASLRDTLPGQTFEDRILFVLNRADECATLNDLIRVYGTLSWNLSQMTGRKDIPPIYITYSNNPSHRHEERPFLQYLNNQSAELKALIQAAPQKRLDNMLNFIVFHAERLSILLRALLSFYRHRKLYAYQWSFIGFIFSSITGVGLYFLWPILLSQYSLGNKEKYLVIAVEVLVVWFIWFFFIQKPLVRRFRKRLLTKLSSLLHHNNQSEKDIWDDIKDKVVSILENKNSHEKTYYYHKKQRKLQKLLQRSHQNFREKIHKTLQNEE